MPKLLMRSMSRRRNVLKWIGYQVLSYPVLLHFIVSLPMPNPVSLARYKSHTYLSLPPSHLLNIFHLQASQQRHRL